MSELDPTPYLFPLGIGLITITVIYAIIMGFVMIRRELQRDRREMVREISGLIAALPDTLRVTVTEALAVRGPSIEEPIRTPLPDLSPAELAEVRNQIDTGQLRLAEAKLLELSGRHPQNFETFDSLVRLYFDPRMKKNPMETLNQVLQKEGAFTSTTKYYRLLASCYTFVRDILPDAVSFIKV